MINISIPNYISAFSNFPVIQPGKFYNYKLKNVRPKIKDKLEMEDEGVLWIFAFAIMLIVLNFVNFLIVGSLKGKALGSQSILDSTIIDAFLVLKCYGMLSCIFSILGRFDYFKNLLINTRILLTLCCFVYIFGLICLCFKGCSFCIIRILCVHKMHLISETIGEYKIRWISALVSFSSGFLAALICTIGKDIESGTQLALLASELKPPGEY